MAHRKPIIGYAWKKIMQERNIEFINFSINRAQLLELEEDRFGNVNLTAAPIREPKGDSKATHVIYEDDILPKHKRK